MKKLSALILGLLMFTLLSCNEEDPCPSCIDDIVTCKVNGKVWRANCKGDGLFGCREITCYYYINDGFGFDLNSYSESDNTSIVLRKNSIKGGLQLGVNNLDHISDLKYSNRSLIGDCKFYYFDSNHFSTITLIKNDSNLFYVEGTFNGRCKNESGDSVIITDGYFKTNYFY